MSSVYEEYNVIKKVRMEIYNAKNRDEINKIYRQARLWNRYHHFYANACSYEKYTFLNNQFKHMRWEALKNIGEK